MPMTWEKNVYSSNVSTIGYDAETQEMYVSWTKGKRSIYSGVPESVAEEIATAPSVGQALNMNIKPYYGHRYG